MRKVPESYNKMLAQYKPLKTGSPDYFRYLAGVCWVNDMPSMAKKYESKALEIENKSQNRTNPQYMPFISARKT